MFFQRALGGATARSAGAHVAVRTEGRVTLRTAPAGVGWAGRDPAVTQVHLQGKVLVKTYYSSYFYVIYA